ncbi:MAG: VOC family protein [Agriterribacter sp.]
MQAAFVDSCTLLQVFDMNTSLKFYCDVLGFVVYQKGGPENDIGWVWLKRGNIHLMLNTAYETADRPPAPDTARMAAHDDTCIYFSCPEVDEYYEYLLAKGVSINKPAIAPYGMKQMYLHDPDGYHLCFQWKV